MSGQISNLGPSGHVDDFARRNLPPLAQWPQLLFWGRFVGSDASHAWVSVWCGDPGWVDLDPTNDIATGDEHVTLAWGRDYGDISPIKGVTFGGGQNVIEVAVDVIPVESTQAVGQASP